MKQAGGHKVGQKIHQNLNQLGQTDQAGQKDRNGKQEDQNGQQNQAIQKDQSVASMGVVRTANMLTARALKIVRGIILDYVDAKSVASMGVVRTANVLTARALKIVCGIILDYVDAKSVVLWTNHVRNVDIRSARSLDIAILITGITD